MLKKAHSSNMKEGKHYRIVESPNHSDHYSILIMHGDYAGIQYMYDGISIAEKDGYANIKYDYIIENENELYNKEELETDHDFIKILNKILENILTEESFKIGKHNAEH
jgi:hypothetical protein